MLGEISVDFEKFLVLRPCCKIQALWQLDLQPQETIKSTGVRLNEEKGISNEKEVEKLWVYNIDVLSLFAIVRWLICEMFLGTAVTYQE